MADTKISALPAATTVGGTDAVPVVQGGTTKQMPMSLPLDRANHTGTQSADTITDGTTNKAYTATEKTKLAGLTGVPSGGTATTFLRGDNTWATPAGGTSVSDATSTTKGVVQLAGDLGGTAAAPTVAKINGLTPATVATSGKYSDLSGQPTIPTVGAAGTAGAALSATDPTTTNARTPTAHAASHASGGSDAITPSAIGGLSAANNLSDLASPATARTNLSVPLASPNGGVKFRDDISAYNINGDSLRSWRFAYAKAKNGEGRAVIGCYGDSTTQGYQATLPQYQNSWVAHMRSLIEGRTGVVAGTGWVTANNVAQDAGENRISFTGSWAAAGYGSVWTNTDYLSSTGGTFTIGPITTDRIRLYYYKWSGGGTATVTVDGSAVASINANAASADVGYTDYTMTQGSHTLVLTAPNGSGAFDLFAWEASQNGTTTGVRIDNLGHNGAKAADLPVTSGTGSGPQIASKANWETLSPNLAIVMFGANDLASVTPSAWQTTMTGIVQKAQGVGASVILVPNIPVSSTYDTSNYYSQYVSATYAIADAQNCVVLDVSKQFKDYTTTNNAGLMHDGQHPNNRGYWAFGNFVATALLNVAVV